MTESEVSALKSDILSSLHAALPGRVISFDAASCTAAIQPMLKSRSGLSLPLLQDVPVFLPSLNGSPAFDISPGDFCLVVFADMAIDQWMMSGEESIPVSDRKHDLSDAFAFVGFHPHNGTT